MVAVKQDTNTEWADVTRCRNGDDQPFRIALEQMHRAVVADQRRGTSLIFRLFSWSWFSR